MASNISNATIKVRRDTAGNWTSNNPTPAQGEWCYETDTGYIKIGDGSTAWTSLDYQPSPSEVDGKLTGDSDQLARAWAYWDGSDASPITPNASYNVTNITTSATGIFTVNFTSAMSGTNYCVLTAVNTADGGSNTVLNILTGGTYTTSAVELICQNSAGTNIDSSQCYMCVFEAR